MSFRAILESFKGCRALVVGDLMLDEYIFGRAVRISQEAPVMVVRQDSTKSVPGGAANVASNMVALGADASIVGIVGADAAGGRLQVALREAGMPASCLIRDPSRPTTRKTRVVANHSHQVLRIDHEEESSVSAATAAELMAEAMTRLPSSQVVLLSDYAKGGVTPETIEALVKECQARSIPLVANPKPKHLPFYRGAFLVSLNRFEAGDALGTGPVQDEEAVDAARALQERLGVNGVLVTLGASGMVAAWDGQTARVPALRVEVYDEAGAGDTVIATVALGIGVGMLGQELLGLAAQMAGAVVQKVGVAVPGAEDLARVAALAEGIL